MKTVMLTLVLTFIVLAGGLARSQSQPASPALSADLGRYYFATPAAEVAARADLDKALGQLGALKGRIDSAAQLLESLRAYAQTRREFLNILSLNGKVRIRPNC